MLLLPCRLVQRVSGDWCIRVGEDAFILLSTGGTKWISEMICMMQNLIADEYSHHVQIEVLEAGAESCLIRFPADNKTIGWIASRINKHRKLHVTDIKKMTGVVHPIISRLFKGVTAPNIPTFTTICEAFDLDIEISFRKKLECGDLKCLPPRS